MTSEPSDDGGAQDVAAAAVAPAAVVRLRLDLGYDGSGFHGWAVQPGRRTVAGVLTDALTTLLRVPVRVVVAGRTDAGVHASGQVAHVDVPEPALVALSPRARGGAAEQDVAAGCRGLLRRLAGLLPADVRVRRVAPAPDGFDARFAALRRHYRYRISTAAWGADPLDRVACWPLGRPLDVEAMSRAAAALLGLHDFAAYCRPRPDATGRPATTVRELQRLAVERVGDEVVLHVSADAFCHSMVRSLVGVLVRVGEGREPVAAPARLLAAGERSSRVATAPACGLTLTGVDYPDDAELAARVAVTRAVREPLDDGPTG